ncbi:MAG: HEAT repeat domain-containing protein [Bryobacteraceae bacterium]|nr:HEAT repeat domain-containing protein [Bryobacteraceae bacterium]
MTCDVVVKQLSLMLYGELTFDEEEAVHQHLEDCRQCGSELARTRRLHRQIESREYEPSTALLQDSRRTLRVSTAALREAGLPPNRAFAFGGLLSGQWLSGQWLSGFLKPVAAVALVAMGFFGGRMVPAGMEANRIAARSGDPVSSRVRFVQPDDSGRVQIVVEETRQRVLEGGLNESHIRGLLLSATREANDPGVRVETMDLLKPQSASIEVRRALLAALVHDTNPGVRLKALEGLRGSASDVETRRVLSQVLLSDQNPGVRTQAIDLLTRDREPAMVGVLQELISREDNNYVRLKCQKVLREMNASVESF